MKQSKYLTLAAENGKGDGFVTINLSQVANVGVHNAEVRWYYNANPNPFTGSLSTRKDAQDLFNTITDALIAYEESQNPE